MFFQVLLIIHECHRILATANGGSCDVVRGEGEGGDDVSERESVAGAALLALQMVETALEKQEHFFTVIRQVGFTFSIGHVMIM